MVPFHREDAVCFHLTRSGCPHCQELSLWDVWRKHEGVEEGSQNSEGYRFCPVALFQFNYNITKVENIEKLKICQVAQTKMILK